MQSPKARNAGDDVPATLNGDDGRLRVPSLKETTVGRPFPFVLHALTDLRT